MIERNGDALRRGVYTRIVQHVTEPVYIISTNSTVQ